MDGLRLWWCTGAAVAPWPTPWWRVVLVVVVVVVVVCGVRRVLVRRVAPPPPRRRVLRLGRAVERVARVLWGAAVRVAVVRGERRAMRGILD
jgi:hypothetical protein